MTIPKSPQKQPDSPFFKDVKENGYHVFSLKKAKDPDYYSNKFPDYPGVKIQDLSVGDIVTVRAFFLVGSDDDVRANGGYLDLEIGAISGDNIMAEILTQLPPDFPLEKGDSLEIYEDEILKKVGE